MPGQGAISSTPATSRYHRSRDLQASYESQDSEFSFSGTIESPLVRLDRDIRNFSLEDTFSQESLNPQTSAAAEQPTYTEDETIHAPLLHRRSPSKGKSRERSLREDVLRTAVSPLRVRGKPKTPVTSQRNPYLPDDMHPRDWTGVVDLRDPKVATPRRGRPHLSRPKPPAALRQEDDDDNDDLLPPGMSPPVMVPFKHVPAFSVGRSPRKDAAARIGNDLIRASRLPLRPVTHAGESSLSSATPPSISRWKHDESTTDSAADSTLESLMQRVRSMGKPNVPPSPSSSTMSSMTLPVQHPLPSYYTPMGNATDEPAPSLSEASYDASASIFDRPASELALPATTFSLPETNPVTPEPYIHEDEYSLNEQYAQDLDSSIDSFDDEVNDAAHPSAGFLLAPGNRHMHDSDSDDDSFDSDGSSVAGDMDDVSLDAPVHPFARGAVAGADDSFDDEDSYDSEELLGDLGGTGTIEETVFGLPLAQREARASEAMGPDGRLRLHGSGTDDTVAGLPTESPTPYNSGDVAEFNKR
jgi:DASH complex subunit ASK1